GTRQEMGANTATRSGPGAVAASLTARLARSSSSAPATSLRATSAPTRATSCQRAKGETKVWTPLLGFHWVGQRAAHLGTLPSSGHKGMFVAGYPLRTS